MDDSEIIRLFNERNERALSEAQTKYSRYCTAIAMNVLGDREEAEDCVNEAFHTAWQLIPPNSPYSLATFLGRLTKNSAVNLLKMRLTQKRGGGETALALDELAECAAKDGVEERFDRRELEKLINRFLAGLTKTNRRMFMLRYWYCYSVREIALRLGTSENTVSVTLNRTRKKLKELLKKRGYDV
ncbi:MAG: sigma-70 family RNA polymerase sigma factor [Lachnospiraceae bacterium]|nr:sigma-70 family RNA polymerase sigma factor [Ruminococcus sp.]MCM1274106.1 sigma-70 family RNA polymerase sigma factor [Lachnospiraceae bacterium]